MPRKCRRSVFSIQMDILLITLDNRPQGAESCAWSVLQQHCKLVMMRMCYSVTSSCVSLDCKPHCW